MLSSTARGKQYTNWADVFVVVGGDHDQAVAAGAQMLLTTARQ
jgi:hypothetical protein